MKHLKVLVVESDKVSQLFMKALLKDLGHDCVVVSTGEEAINAYDGSYDFVLTELNQTYFNGFKITKLLREKEKTLNTTVIIIALTVFDKRWKQYCLENGMNDFLSKPLYKEELVAVLNKYP